MAQQTSIPEQPTSTPAPGMCEWCEEEGVAIERKVRVKGRKGRVGTRQFVYACWDHKRLADQVANP